MTVAAMGSGVSFECAIQLVGLMTFDFDLDRRVADAEVMAQFIDDRLENLLALANRRLGDQDVAAASDDSGSDRPRPAFRWRQVVALARVMASAYGYNRDDKHGFRAAGYEDVCKLLSVEA